MISLKIEYREYSEPTKLEPFFLPKEEYGRCIQTLPKFCVDVLPIDRSRQVFYLAKRIIEPLKDNWWFIGGRANAGEGRAEAAARHFKTDTTLDLPSERFGQPIAFHHYTFSRRQEEPQDIGSDTPTLVFTIELDEKELLLASLNLNKKEYKAMFGLREFNLGRMVEYRVRQAILDLYDQIFPS